MAKRTDELSNALKRADEAKNEILYLKFIFIFNFLRFLYFLIKNSRSSIEKLEDKVRYQENTINSLTNEGDFTGKRIGEMKDRIKDSFSDNEKYKLQNSALQMNMNQIVIDLENYKNENYQLKQSLLEKQQKEINLVLSLEKANLQTNQFKKMLQKTEYNIEVSLKNKRNYFV